MAQRIGEFFKTYRKILFAVIWALILLPFLVVFDNPEVRCAYVVLLMAGYWMVECFPMAVTALLPVVMFPTLGILSTMETCSCYMNDTIMVFIGGLILALAIEHSRLHLRIALGVMRKVGCSHARLLAGLCTVTTFISMWVTNTAATAMMLPIIFAVLQELEQAGFGSVYEKIGTAEPGSADLEQQQSVEGGQSEQPKQEQQPSKVTKAYLLATAYCATFGGTGSLVGTGTNLTFKGIFESTFPNADAITLTNWMIANVPHMIINAFLTWLYVRVAFLGFLRPRSKDAQSARIGRQGELIANEVIRGRYADLGSISFHESAVAVLFALCVLLWIFRHPGFVTGWAELITDKVVKDSVPVILVSILMFYIPRDPNFIYWCSRDPVKRAKANRASEGLITWSLIQSKMPWGLLFLLGGGFAISKGSIESGLAKRIADSMVPLRHLHPILILVLVSLLIGILTEFTSNVGIANITLPVIAQMCVAMRMHPLYLMIPATVMCSFAFRLAVGTPPNALIVVSAGLPTRTLLYAGCIPSIYALIVTAVIFLSWGCFVYDIHDFPAWADEGEQA